MRNGKGSHPDQASKRRRILVVVLLLLLLLLCVLVGTCHCRRRPTPAEPPGPGVTGQPAAEAPKGAPSEYLDFKLSVGVLDGKGIAQYTVAPEAELAAGSRVCLRVRPGRDAFVYALLFDKDEQAALLHPVAAPFEPGSCMKVGFGDALVIPAPAAGERSPGRELTHPAGPRTLYVIVNEEPWDVLEKLLQRLTRTDEPDRGASLRLAYMLRGRPSVTRQTWQTAGEGIDAERTLHVEPIEPGVPLVARIPLVVR